MHTSELVFLAMHGIMKMHSKQYQLQTFAIYQFGVYDEQPPKHYKLKTFLMPEGLFALLMLYIPFLLLCCNFVFTVKGEIVVSAFLHHIHLLFVVAVECHNRRYIQNLL